MSNSLNSYTSILGKNGFNGPLRLEKVFEALVNPNTHKNEIEQGFPTNFLSSGTPHHLLSLEVSSICWSIFFKDTRCKFISCQHNACLLKEKSALNIFRLEWGRFNFKTCVKCKAHRGTRFQHMFLHCVSNQAGLLKPV